tara:strand:+ start:36150 stop:40244 length:4095 start_codon:yes stop_codon:yes gene_type:complete
MKKIIKQVGNTFLLLTTCGLFSAGINAQTQNTGNNLWSFPPNYFDQQNLITPLPEGLNPFDDYNGAPSTNSHNVVRDMDGNIRFFVVDERVFNKEGRLIDRMYSGGVSSIKGAAETLILPYPGDCQKYYIFATGRPNYGLTGQKEPFYSIVDLSAQNIYDSNTTGALEYTNSGNATSIADITPTFYGDDLPSAIDKFGNIFFAATKENCSGERFVFVSSEFGIHKYILDENGLNYSNEFIPFDLPSTFNQIKMRSGMEVIELSNGNYRIAVGHASIQNGVRGTALFTAELNGQGVLIPNSQISVFLENDGVGTIETQAYIHGLEFSPDGSKLYITHNTNNNNPYPIEYFDFDNAGINQLQPLIVPNDDDFHMSQMEIDIDGDLVLVTNDRIAALENPNTPDVNNWVNIKVPFSSTYQANDEGTNTTNTTVARAITSYIFPDQVGGMNYTEHLTSNLACLGETNSSNTWSPGNGNNPFGSINGDVYIDGDLTIPAGTNIQINDMTFYFSPGSKLIVERGNTNSNTNGARLALNNTTLTVDDRCSKNAMWNGVQVRGYNTQNQSPLSTTNQGWLRMFNNSRIEHAYIGVATTIYDSQSNFPFRPGQFDFSATGGIIQVSNSTFYNNRQDILLQGYQAPNGNDNLMYARNCEFITDGLLNDVSVYPLGHITSISNVGLDLFGNDYINLTPDLYDFNKQGAGVVAINSQFKIKARCQGIIPIGSSCNNFDRSKFQNLYFGVYSLSSISGRKTTIDRSLFVNNYFGALLGNDDYAEVTRNDFEVYRSAAPNETFRTYGLFLGSCDGYQVEENTFTEYNDPNVSTPGNTYGVIVNNSGTEDNLIYRNEFFDLRVGSQAQGINGYNTVANQPPTLIKGLQFKCNHYYNDIYTADIAVTSGLIRREQGDCDPTSNPNATEKPAGNRFSHSGNFPTNDIAVNFNVVDFEYAHHADLITTPIDYSVNKVALNYCASLGNDPNNPDDPVYFDEENSCPSRIIELGPIGVGPLLPLFKGKLDSLKAVIAEKESVIDDNQTAFLINLIGSSNNGNIKNTLLDISPYLSDEVLIQYILSNPPMGHLKQVVLANSPLSDDVMNVLESINVSNGIMNQINNVQFGKSERDRLISDINYDRTERTLLLNQTIRLVLEDTIMPGRLDTVAVLLKEESRKRKKEQLCDVYFCDKDSVNFDNTRAELELQHGYNNYIKVAELNEVLSTKTGTVKTDTLRTDTGLRQNVENVAYDQFDRINSVRGEALLSLYLDSLFQPYVEPLLTGGSNKSFDIEESNDRQSTPSMKLFPNPSKGSQVTVDFDVEAYENPIIELVDISGKRITDCIIESKIGAKINTDHLEAGIYFVNLLDNGNFIETQKLIIQ